jgi:hypothetical protein
MYRYPGFITQFLWSLDKSYGSYAPAFIVFPYVSFFFRTPDENDESRSHCVCLPWRTLGSRVVPHWSCCSSRLSLSHHTQFKRFIHFRNSRCLQATITLLGFHSGDHADLCLLGYNTVQPGESPPTLLRGIPPPSSGSKKKPIRGRWQAGSPS